MKLQPEEVMETITEKIDPTGLNIGIRSVHSLYSGSLKFRVKTEQDVENLKNAIEELPEMNDKVKITKPKKRNPKLILLNVPNTKGKDELLHKLYEQNKEIRGKFSSETFKQGCDISHAIPSKKRKDHRHIIVAVVPAIRNTLIPLKQLSYEWGHLIVDDYIPIVRCFKCTGFGHIAKFCDQSEKCSQCTKKHNYKDCTKRHEEPKCINCYKANKRQPEDFKYRTDHNAFSANCPLLKNYKRLLVRQTLYE
ncbi:uncharacterized protein LOC111612785 [Centruroides sculpturatus]|uniref:uncharacterized protein LOC111612785 n=1 Tax=Centruroides sculpturatus TaxID=218467 RepID=UPI000C6CE48E|nr:uncharacterized protein LOC111612785 [Centruroides sculpturatus]